MKKIAALLSLAFFAVKPAEAGTLADWGNFLLEDIKDIRCQHNYDVYVPFYAWHNRLAYDQEHIDKYNENAFLTPMMNRLGQEYTPWDLRIQILIWKLISATPVNGTGLPAMKISGGPASVTPWD